MSSISAQSFFIISDTTGEFKVRNLGIPELAEYFSGVAAIDEYGIPAHIDFLKKPATVSRSPVGIVNQRPRGIAGEYCPSHIIANNLHLFKDKIHLFYRFLFSYSFPSESRNGDQ
jgi:hypothetical protein